MNKLSALTVPVLACASLANAQMGRTLDWTTYGGDAQRSGWEKQDVQFSKEVVAKGLPLLWKKKVDSKQRGSFTVMPPVIVGNLIGYRGFKELAFLAGSDDSLHVMDSDLNRMYWQRQFDDISGKKAAATAACPGGMTSMPTLMALTFRRPAPRPAPAAPGNGGAATAVTRPANPMFGPRSVYLITSDGKLRRVNVANGSDSAPAVQAVPANSRVSTLNLVDNTIYATTSNGCGGAPNAVWAVDISDPDPLAAPKTNSFNVGGNLVGMSGPVIGTDGTVYVQTGEGASDPANGKFANALVALTPKELKLKGYFAAAGGNSAKGDKNAVSPVVFAYKGKDMIAAAGRDGRLYLLDAASVGGSDHQTAVSQTDPVVSGEGTLWGGLSSFEDSDGTRWVLATTWGAGNGKGGSIVAYKVSEQGGKPALTPGWTSRELTKPVPPVTASGVVFVLSSGDAASKAKAVLYALDAATGKEIWSTKNEVAAPGNLTGLTVANGRVYFVTTDNTVWVYGVPLEI